MGGNPSIRNILRMVLQLTLDFFNSGTNGIRIWMDNCKPILESIAIFDQPILELL